MADELTIRQAREALAKWAADFAAVLARRDPAVRAAVAAGVSKSEAHRITGLARNTVHDIVAGESS